jgi:hypothetical protein
MTRAHNKRRNTGLMYEFLVRTISSALVEGDKKKSSAALKILKRHFKPGTELYREFRLINALVRTTVSSEAVAASILNEAKGAAKEYDSSALDREKSLLIKHINYTFKDQSPYEQFVSEYKTYATAQTLLNEWRAPAKERNLSEVARFEDQMIRWLLSEKSGPSDSHLIEESDGTSKLMMKVMTKKINEKYASTLNENQRAIIKSYVFSKAQNDSSSLERKLEETRVKILKEVDEYKRTNGDEYLKNKINEVRGMISGENLKEISDETITRFMLYAKLSSELNSSEE